MLLLESIVTPIDHKPTAFPILNIYVKLIIIHVPHFCQI